MSVLIACRNAAFSVEAAIDSVLDQTYPHLDVVVVDDGSTDGSGDIIERAFGHKITLLRQDNKGAACARNLALSKAQGAFVLFFDADDIIAPTHLEALVSRATEQPDVIALSRWSRFRTSLDEATFPYRPTERDLPGPDWLALDWRNARPMTQSGMLLLPRRLIERHGGWDERLSLNDDFEFFSRMISRSSGVRFAPDARLYYRSCLPGSLSGRKTRAAIESAYLSADLGTRHLLAARDTPATRRVCANIFQDFDYTYYPHHADLRARAQARTAELGGSDLEPDGPPGFRRLRGVVGWKPARLAQHAYSKLRRAVRGDGRRSAAVRSDAGRE